jgi:lysyl-tRNA synthetase class II
MNAGGGDWSCCSRSSSSTADRPDLHHQFPVETSPLARRNDANPADHRPLRAVLQHREIANAFSELNDPVDQAAALSQAQVDAKARGQQETMDFDADYIRALEHGMPPTAGEGMGIDRLVMLFTDAQSIREVILFPTWRRCRRCPRRARRAGWRRRGGSREGTCKGAEGSGSWGWWR